MSRMQRDKGRKAEAEVRAIYEAAGFTVRGLEGGGDHLAIRDRMVLHSEVKRQEVLRLPLWCRQALADSAAGPIPVVAFRRNHERWQAVTPAERVEGYLHAAGLAGGVDYGLRDIGGAWWVLLPLEDLLTGLVWGSSSPTPQEALS